MDDVNKLMDVMRQNMADIPRSELTPNAIRNAIQSTLRDLDPEIFSGLEPKIDIQQDKDGRVLLNIHVLPITEEVTLKIEDEDFANEVWRYLEGLDRTDGDNDSHSD